MVGFERLAAFDLDSFHHKREVERKMVINMRQQLAALATLAALAVPSVSSAGQLCFIAGQTYKIYYDSLDAGYAIGGIRYGSSNMPIAGSAYTSTDGHIIIGFEEMFNWGTGDWIHPNGTAYIDWTAKTYDITYHGNGAPVNITGTVVPAACPSVADMETMASGADPNL